MGSGVELLQWGVIACCYW